MTLTRKELFKIYIDKGLKLIPLLGKQRITKDSDEVDIYKYEDCKYSIGVLTGGISEIVVIDLDNIPDEIFNDGIEPVC